MFACVVPAVPELLWDEFCDELMTWGWIIRLLLTTIIIIVIIIVIIFFL
jgi:hypothetical protein